ncbi:hypothetical protein EHM76_00415 [bacterium]|nr:MAG: hypothetical protein EHM76_00415 [bacterium]
MNAPQVISKLSAQKIVGNVKAYAPQQGKDGSIPKDIVPLYRIFGSANGLRVGQSDNGPFVALLGRFEAQSMLADEDGVVSEDRFIAAQCFLPGPTHALLVDKLSQKDAEGKRLVESLDFAFEVGVKAAKTPIGYEYVCVPLMEDTGSDPLAALRDKVKALPSALPGANKGAALPAPATPAAKKK